MKTLILPDNRTLAYRDQGDGPPLVMLHGWSMSSAVFSEAIENFSTKFRVLAPDLRGHGKSSTGQGYALADFSADLLVWLERLGIERLNLVGWSLGGQISLVLAQRLGARVDRLILNATTPRFAAGGDWAGGLPVGQVRAMARNLKRDYRRTMEEFFHLQFAGEDLSRERLRSIVAFAVRQSNLPEPEVALACLQTLESEDQRSLLAEINSPTLVLQGTEDRITVPAAGEYLAANLPKAHLCLLQGIGHAPFLSRSEETFRQWQDFLI